MLGSIGDLAAGLTTRGIGAATGAASATRATAGAWAGDLVDYVVPGRERYDAEDPGSERDPAFIDRTLSSYRALAHAYFRPHIRGLEQIPATGPVLLVGNHSGGSLIADTFVFSYDFLDHFGSKRRYFQLAHDFIFRVPGLAGFRKYGMVPAAPDNARAALGSGAAVLVYPGGDWETYRPTWRSGEVDLAGRKGFIDIALEADAPICPIVAIGGQETALFVTRGERAAKLTGVDKTLRLKVLPLQLAPPFGLTLLDFPFRIPLPAQITIQVLPPIDVRAEFGADPDRDEVYDFLVAEMQRALDELVAERDLPLVGTVGERDDESEAFEAALAGRSA